MSGVFSSPVSVSKSQNHPRWTAPASFLSKSSKAWGMFYLTCVMLVMSAKANSESCASSFDPNLDYFPDKVDIPEEADLFTVSYHNNYKVLVNSHCEETYVLTHCGTPRPDASEFSPGTKFFDIPLQSVGVDDTTTVTFLELLGLRSAIRYVTKYTVSSCVDALSQQGKIEFFESLWDNATVRDSQIDEVDAALGSCGGNDKTIALSVQHDPSPLNRAEWIDFVAVLFNKEAEANLHFSGTQTRYQCHSDSVSALGKPVVAWMNYNAYSEPPSFYIDVAPYRLSYIKGAGGTPFSPPTTSFVSADALIDALSEGGVDILIDETYNYSPTTYKMTASLFNFPADTDPAAPKFIRNRQVWRWDKSGKVLSDGSFTYDWFESAMPDPDVVQQDLIAILHPTCSPIHSKRWFRNLALDEESWLPVETCSDVNGVLPARGVACPKQECKDTNNIPTFDFGSGCDAGSGDFMRTLDTAFGTSDLGVIPADKYGVRVNLFSPQDIDIQLLDIEQNSQFSEGQAVVAYCQELGCNGDTVGFGFSATEIEADYKRSGIDAMRLKYSGYNGVNNKLGNEFIEVIGRTTTDLMMRVFAFKTGEARVEYSWERSETACCRGLEACAGEPFTADVKEKEIVTIGEIPVGKKNVRIELKSLVDVDIQLYDTSDTSTFPEGKALIGYCEMFGCNFGTLAGPDRESWVFDGVEYIYSGYNGAHCQNSDKGHTDIDDIGCGSYTTSVWCGLYDDDDFSSNTMCCACGGGIPGELVGHEYIEIVGVTNRPLSMKAFGYREGIAAVSYSWYEVGDDQETESASARMNHRG